MREYGNIFAKLSSRVPWFLMLDNTIILNKNGSLQKTIEIRGYDLETQIKEAMLAYNNRLNNVLKRLEDKMTFHIDTIRTKSKKYESGNFPDKLGQIIENQREHYFNSGNHFESKTYITFTYTIPLDNVKKLEKLYIESTEKDFDIDYLESFKKEFYSIFDMLKSVFLKVEELDEEATLTYLHSLVSMNEQKVILPDVPIYLSNYLCDCHLKGGLQLKLEENIEEEYITPISIVGFPHKSRPCFFDELNALDIEYRWNIRYRALGKQKALSRLQTLWGTFFKNRFSLWQMAKQELTGKEPVTMNEAALESAGEIKVQENLTEGDYVGQGYYTNLLIVRDKDKKELDRKVRLINEVIRRMGFVTIVETYNSLYSWLGSLPGDLYHNERDFSIQNSLTASHLFPLSAIWAGDEWNNHLNAPSLLYCQTKKTTPFRLNLHDGQVGHTAVLGKTGGGKSVLLGTLAYHFRKYENAKVYFFDKDRSSLVLTLATGGKFYDIGEDESELAFQPLRNIDNEIEREWANNFILDILEAEKVLITATIKKSVWQALELLSKAPISSRTFSNFSATVDKKEIKTALESFTSNGALGRYFDGTNDSLDIANWTVFEMAKIIDNKQVIPHLLAYLFHKIESALDGSPTMIVLDECWMFLDNPKFAQKMKDWLKTFRKKNAFIVFATQELSDVKKSSIYDTIREACVTKIYLGNKNALTEANKGLYTEFGLNLKEIGIISNMIERKDYFLKQQKGSRCFDLSLSALELAFIASTDIESQNMAINIYMEVNKNADKFCDEWLIYKGIKK